MKLTLATASIYLAAVVAPALAATDPAASKLATAMLPCWSLLPAEKALHPKVVMEVVIGPKGYVQGVPKPIDQPHGPSGGAIARAAQRAAMACATYDVDPPTPTSYTVTLQWPD